MKGYDPIYRKLQKHLHASTLGYPSVSSGADIRILEFMFTPDEAKIALHLDGRGSSIGEIESRINAGMSSRNDFAAILDCMAAKGAIEKVERSGAARYRLLPLIVGMYEAQGMRITPEFVKNFRAYTDAPGFGLSFLATKVPQMRTIPVGKSVTPEMAVQTYDEIERLVEEAEGPIALMECICRKSHTLEGDKCGKTSRLETCIAFGEMAHYVHGAGSGRLVDKDEIREVLKRNQEEGLVLQPSNTRKAEFVCSCCGCCCGMLSWQQDVPRPVNFWSSNYFAAVDRDLCNGCGLCAKRCQVKAAGLDKKKKKASVNLDRCIGCGVCVPSCKQGAIGLVKKSRETVPPSDADELNELILRGKKGIAGTMGVVKKMLFREK